MKRFHSHIWRQSVHGTSCPQSRRIARLARQPALPQLDSSWVTFVLYLSTKAALNLAKPLSEQQRPGNCF